LIRLHDTKEIPIDGDLESKQRLVEQFALLAGRPDNRPEIAVVRTERGDDRREHERRHGLP
jgi:hypothetical protein